MQPEAQTEEIAAPAPLSPAVAANAVAVAPAPAKKGWSSFKFTRKFLIISVLAHLVFAGGAAVWIVQSNRDKPKRTFLTASNAPNASTRALEHKVQLKKRNTMSAPVAAKRVTTTGLAKMVMPPMPVMTSQLAPISPASRAAGMGGVGVGAALGGGGAGSGFGKSGGTMFMASIGGLSVQAKQLAVALDISGSVAKYQDDMQKFVTKTFKDSEVGTFSLAAFKEAHGRSGSIGTVVLGFLNSPKKFDSIYIFSDFGETDREEQDALPEIQKLIREKKVRLYLHVLRAPGKEGDIRPNLQSVIQFARSTGGNVKIGEMPHM